MTALKLKAWQKTATVSATALVLGGLDQWAKVAALENLQLGRSVEVVEGLLWWRLAFNDAAGFSLGFGATWFFTLLSSAALIAVLLRSHRVKNLLWLSLAGVLAGGILGNLIDRLFREPSFANGHVVDYIQIPFNFPIFNIADICITVSMGLIALRIVLGDKVGGEKDA